MTNHLKVALLAGVLLAAIGCIHKTLPRSSNAATNQALGEVADSVRLPFIDALRLTNQEWKEVCLTDDPDKLASEGSLSSRFLGTYYTLLDASGGKWWLVYRNGQEVVDVVAFDKRIVGVVSYRGAHSVAEFPSIRACASRGAASFLVYDHRPGDRRIYLTDK